MFSTESLTASGFTGFLPLESLRGSAESIPRSPGVYVVTCPELGPPTFLDASVGGRFKGKDPTVPRARLESEWVNGTETLYIGKANDLRRRLIELAKFGQGVAIGHWGGRLLWQLERHCDLNVAWRTNDDPVDAEATMIEAFVERHGRPPFANLTRGRRDRVLV